MRGYFDFGSDNIINSVKNAVNIASITYATHWLCNMVMDFVPEDIKLEYVDPVLDWSYETTAYGIDHIAQAAQTCFE